MGFAWVKKLVTWVCLFVLLVFVGVVGLGCLPAGETASDVFVDSGLDYSESGDFLNNPWRGFYFTQPIKLKIAGNSMVSPYGFSSNKDKHKLVHIRVGLESFSSNAGGTDMDISEDALLCLENMLSVVRQNDLSVVIRFSYNVDGDTVDGRYAENEPALELMLRHIEQLGALLDENIDVVAAIETGMLGPWGEQHGTAAAKEMSNFYAITQKWLDSTSEVCVSLRRPLFFVHWYNGRYQTDYTIDKIDQIPAAQKGSDAYRVGVYNDGYLGSESDLGTYTNREKEVAWLTSQASHTFFGGEVVANSPDLIGSYNNIDFITDEGFRTHTTYLNLEWNYRVINAWKDAEYTGENAAFLGLSQFDFIESRLGYRFVLRNSEYALSGTTLKLKGKIQNVGFAPLLKSVNSKLLIISDQTPLAEIPLELDLNAGEYEFCVQIPSQALNQACQVYIKTDAGIAFANNDIYDHELRANKICTLNF